MNEITIKDMTKEQLLELQEQVGKKLDEAERKSLVFVPNNGEGYFYIEHNSMYYTNHQKWEDEMRDKNNITMGNCFYSREEAQAELARRKALVTLKKWIDENDSERGGRFIVGKRNYFIYPSLEKYDPFLDYEWNSDVVYSNLPHLSSGQKAEQCIKDIGDEIKCLFTQYIEDN